MLRYVDGDASVPELYTDKHNYLFHIVNNIGRWGAGFTKSLNKNIPQCGKDYRAYMNYHKGTDNRRLLGDFFQTEVSSNFSVVHLFAQKGVRGPQNPHPLDYAHLNKCMKNFKKYLKVEGIHSSKVCIHMPKIGTGLAGGQWNKIAPSIERILGQCETVVYLPE